LKFDKEKRRYIREDGSVISSREMRKLVDETTVTAALYLMTIAERARSEDAAELQLFADEMRSIVRSSHRAFAVVAFGGIEQMTDDAWNFADEREQFHAGFLDAYLSQVFMNAIKRDATFVARSALYAAAGYSTYESAVALRESAAGMTLYRRRLDAAAQNCEECKVYEKLGWRLIHTLPNIGEKCSCRARCRCFFQFKKGTLEDIDDSQVTPLTSREREICERYEVRIAA
jgi:hypothetical protein